MGGTIRTPMRGEREHVLQMDLAQRRLTRHEHEPAPLLEDHVRGAAHQPVGVSGADTGEGLHRARHDHHAVGPERTRGDRAPWSSGRT